MPGPEFLLPFLLTALLLSVTPGPGMVYIAAQTIGRGRRAGWFSALGTHLASYVHIAAAAFGLSLFLTAVPAAYLGLKILGAGYLVWLGLRFLTGEADDMSHVAVPARPAHLQALRDSLVVELTNPKSAVFFLAFLPQFTDPAASLPLWAQILVLGSVANVIFTLAEISCVIFADRLAAGLATSRAAGRWMRRAAGTVLIGLGAHLLLSRS